MEHVNRVVSWKTNKVDNGYEFTVYSFDYQIPNVIHKTGVLPTRAKSATVAKKWKMHYQAIAKRSQSMGDV